ncbi:MAG: hypothetical protein ABIH59_01435 [archaeon]
MAKEEILGLNLDFKLSNDVLYVGIDESNHGLFPVIFVAAFSLFEKDILPPKEGVKIRKHANIISRVGGRDYSFLLASQGDYLKIPEKEFLGRVVGSLLYKKLGGSREEFLKMNKRRKRLDLFIDGVVGTEEKNYVRDVVSEILLMRKRMVRVLSGANYDTKYRVVNIADELAHYLLRECTEEELYSNPNLQQLIS